MLSQDAINIVLILRVDVLHYNALCRGHNHCEVVLINNHAKGSLQTEVTIILHAAIFDVKTIKELAIALVPPSHPVTVLPFGNFSPRLNRLAKVRLYQRTEVINAECVHKVLHTSIGAYITVSMISLRCEDCFHAFHNVFLWNKTKMISNPGKGSFLVMGTAHTTSNHNVETFELTLVIGNYHTSNIIRIHIKRVITWNRYSNLELPGQIAITVDRLGRIWQDNSTAAIIHHCFIDIQMLHLLAPGLDSGNLLTIQPDGAESRGHWSEELSKRL
mmetsp:Transcript_7247/g.10669  ORF Transcript_7247/g.10669 Transcript_7247/m.10669 type:complete len:274 (+) Transcript_7247:595-1416(+)